MCAFQCCVSEHASLSLFLFRSLFLSARLTAVVGGEAAEGEGEGWGSGARPHSRGGFKATTGHDGRGGDVTRPQICTRAGWLICVRSKRREKKKGRKKRKEKRTRKGREGKGYRGKRRGIEGNH